MFELELEDEVGPDRSVRKTDTRRTKSALSELGKYGRSPSQASGFPDSEMLGFVDRYISSNLPRPWDWMGCGIMYSGTLWTRMESLKCL